MKYLFENYHFINGKVNVSAPYYKDCACESKP